MMCPDGLAMCVFETGLAVIGVVCVAAALGLFSLFGDKS